MNIAIQGFMKRNNTALLQVKCAELYAKMMTNQIGILYQKQDFLTIFKDYSLKQIKNWFKLNKTEIEKITFRKISEFFA